MKDRNSTTTTEIKTTLLRSKMIGRCAFAYLLCIVEDVAWECDINIDLSPSLTRKLELARTVDDAETLRTTTDTKYGYTRADRDELFEIIKIITATIGADELQRRLAADGAIPQDAWEQAQEVLSKKEAAVEVDNADVKGEVAGATDAEPEEAVDEVEAPAADAEDDDAEVEEAEKSIDFSMVKIIGGQPMIEENNDGIVEPRALTSAETAAYAAWRAGEEKKKAEVEKMLPERFSFKDTGLYYKTGVDEDGNPKNMWVCQHFDVLGKTKNKNNSGTGLLIQFKDGQGNVHTINLLKEDFATDCADIKRELLSRDFIIDDQIAKFKSFMIQVNPSKIITTINEIGRHDIAGKTIFMLPSYGAIKTIDKEIVFTKENLLEHKDFSSSGTLADWQNNVAHFATGNYLLLHALNTAIASPLLNITNDDGGIFHIVGGSSSGKTTAAEMGCSVWGNSKKFLKSWRTTDNALESTLVEHSETFIALDEMGMNPDPRNTGNISYMIANGNGKSRANRKGDARMVKSWKLLGISTGEVALENFIDQMGGQEVRFLSLDADAGSEMGILNNTFDLSAKEIIDTIKTNSKKFYGVAGIAFLTRLIEDENTDIDALKNKINGFVREFTTSLDAYSASTVNRIIQRFGLLAAAGELAIEYGIFPFQKGDAINAEVSAFHNWISRRGTDGSIDETNFINSIKEFLTTENRYFHQLIKEREESLYFDEKDYSVPIKDYGYHVIYQENEAIPEEWWVNSDGFRAILKNFGKSLKIGTQILIDNGILKVDMFGTRKQQKRRPPKDKQRRFYILQIPDEE